MSTYNPDRWVIVEINSQEHGLVYKVLGSWGGGYTQGQSWKLSSGFDMSLFAEETSTHYRIDNFSGSVYEVSKHKAAYGMTSFAISVYESFVRDIAKFGGSIRIVDREDVPKILRMRDAES